MIYSNSNPSQNSCQPLFDNQLNFNDEDVFLNDCRAYCTSVIQLPESPWQCHANLMGYWYSKGQTKISKLQRSILHYLHQWYFSKGNPAYLKSSNLAKKVKSSRRNTIRAITRLIERGILIRLEYWSNRYQRFRSVIMPRMYQTLKEKLVFQLEKRTHPFTETDTGGCVRYFSKMLKSLRIKNANIYTNILCTNILLTKTLDKHLITLNAVAPKQSNVQLASSNHLTKEGTLAMQIKSKPKRLVLKVKEQTPCPSNITETLDLLERNDYNPRSIPKVTLSELFYFLENKIFYGYGANNPEIAPLDLHRLFKFNAPKTNKFIEGHDRKLFKMLIDLYKNSPQVFNHPDINDLVLSMMRYWNACVKKPKDTVRKFNGLQANTKTLTGFKVFLGIADLFVRHFSFDKDYMEANKNKFKKAIGRYFNYSYILNLPQNIRFEVTLIDPLDKGQFLKCLTSDDEQFQDTLNVSRRVYQEKPENQKSMRNLKEIFVDSFYHKTAPEGKKRFEQYRPRFARWLEILIHRIEKYSDNGKCVELHGLKLTAETQADAPVLYYYFEWLKNNIFSETYFQFDEMFSLQNWNSFVKKYMRMERGYSDYWKIVDKN